ncbi:MAG: Smr/MutS family protein [Hyphomicrobiaceae bacterium]
MSTSGRRRGRGRDTLLGEEDRRLWEQVARSIGPARRGKPRVPETGCSPEEQSSSGRPMEPAHVPAVSSLTGRLASAAASVAGERVSPRVAAGGPHEAPSGRTERHAGPDLANFDRNALRRIRSGRIAIEARLDLHGMRQDEAHFALRSFIAGCQSRGMRWVLVITGKGKPVATHLSDQPFDGYSADRGVLRRQVPRWLADADMRALVVSYAPAAAPHGGEGAIYVQLRPRRHAR